MLTGDAKTQYQREYMRRRRAAAKGLTVRPNSVRPVMPVRPIVAPEPIEPPIYNPSVHKPGNTVRMRQGNKFITVTVPELDADGNAIYGGAW
jgi:hypothetical protein